MGSSHGRAHHHRDIELSLISMPLITKSLHSWAVGRFKEGKFSEFGVVAVVLFVLSAEKSWIVSRHDHEPCFQSRVDRVEE